MLLDQTNLFGEPPIVAASSQWFTPPWLCRKVASWLPVGAKILEPSCGRGNLIEGLLRAGHAPASLSGIERDPLWAKQARLLLPDVAIETADFLHVPVRPFHFVVGNFPFEENAHMRFALHALKFAETVIGVFPGSFEFGKERDRELWAQKAVVVRRARLPERVDYGGEQSPSFDSVVLKIKRRDAPRAPDELLHVIEEVWHREAA